VQSGPPPNSAQQSTDHRSFMPSAALKLRHEQCLLYSRIKFAYQFTWSAILSERHRSKSFASQFLKTCFRSG
jgi:hypothetical protein